MSGGQAVELRFPVPAGRILSINENAAHNWAARRSSLKPWREEVGWAWLLLSPAERAKVANVPCRVQVTLGFDGDRRRDPHNYVGTVVKAMVDQLVEQGVWPDDNPDWVTVDEPVCRKGKEVVVRLVPRG